MLQGCRILVVEDDTLIAIYLKTVLQGEGCAPTVVPNVRRALGLLCHGFDAAVLDVALRNGEHVGPVAARLRELGVPYLYASSAGIAADVADPGAPILLKPYGTLELVRAVAALLNPTPST